MEPDLFTRARLHPDGYRVLAPANMGAVPDGARLIDVREPGEFDAELGHIPGAELVPLAAVEGAAATWDHGTLLVMVCRSGARSGRAALALVRQGFQRVVNLDGGMIAYNAAGLPVVRAGR